jgi:hypothetical protein
MTRRAPAHRLWAAVAAMCVAESVRAGAWTTEPVLGLQTDFSTNPALVLAGHTTNVDGAILIDAPTTYTGNAWSFALQPSFRFTDNSGYTSLVSNYEHLGAVGEFDTERNSLKVTTLALRDSSLYQDYNFSGSIGVRQDTALADIGWVSQLNERLTFNVDASYSRVRYGQSTGVATLTDYGYSSTSPALSWQATELTSLTLLAGFSLYKSLDGSTRSSDTNLEIGFVRQLTELWNLSAKAGASRESDQINEYFGPFFLGALKSTANGTVFSADLTRQGLRLATTLSASRSLVPSGFAFLSRRDRYELQAVYPCSERWTLQGYVRYRNEQDPQFFVPTVERKYTDMGLSAAWLATEHWTLTTTVSHVREKFGPPDFQVAETAVRLSLARHFSRIDWH